MKARIIPKIASVVISCTMLCSQLAGAQPSGSQIPGTQPSGRNDAGQRQERQGRHPKLSSEEKAGRISDRMKEELGLSDGQYKKVYKLFLKDAQLEAEQVRARYEVPGRRPEGKGEAHPERRRGGFQDGDGVFGGEQGHSGFGHSGGGPQGFQGGRGGFQGGPRGPQGGPQGEMGSRSAGESSDVFSEEYISKREKKLKSILKQEKYDIWRHKHPVEIPPLPDPVFKF